MPNHPPLPVVEALNPAVIVSDDCEALKIKFGVQTNTHGKNAGPKSRSYQSHHILQDHQMKKLIGVSTGQAVLLFNSHSGTEHREITNRQNARRDAKGGTGGPASNYGEVKKQAKEDLVAGFSKPDDKRKDGDQMTDAERDQLADCLVAEADNQAQQENGRREARKKKKDDDYQPKKLNDATPVSDWGCFQANTVIWLEDGTRTTAEQIKLGDRVATAGHATVVTRIDRCTNKLVRLVLDGWDVEMAPMHRVRLASGVLLDAAELQPGQRLATANGYALLTAIEFNPDHCTVFSFGFGSPTDCAIGTHGLWVEMRHLGPPLRPFCSFELDQPQQR